MTKVAAIIDKGWITVEQSGHPAHLFKIVKKLPHRYGIWPIGDNMGTDDYVPFCEPKPDYGPYSVNPDTLLAIKLPPDEVAILRKASAYGSTITQLEKALRRKNKDRVKLATAEELSQAIIILRRLKEGGNDNTRCN